MPSDDDIPFVDRRRLRWATAPDSLLGQGSFGIVYRGTWNGTPVAIKVVKPATRSDNTTEEYRTAEAAAMKQHRREIHRFRVVQNPYIIQYLGVFRDRNPRDLYIVTEYLEGGSLHDSLCKMRARHAVLDDRSFLQIAQHMAFGLNHVHSTRYTHGDMKPQNVLLTEAFQFQEESGHIHAFLAASAKVKIADFGLSKRLEGAEPTGFLDSTAATTDFGTGPCGTYLYMSPEAYHGVSQLTDADAKAADVYAYGLILFELLSGHQSWGLERVRNPMTLHLLVRDGKRPAWGEREDCINSDYIRLVERCWSHEAEDRPTVDDIVNSLEELQTQYTEQAERNANDISPQVVAVSNVTKAEHHASKNSSHHTERLPQTPSDAYSAPHSDDDDNTSGSEDFDEDSHGGFLSEEGRRPTIVPVDSMRRLTDSQVAEHSDWIGSNANDESQEYTLSCDEPVHETDSTWRVSPQDAEHRIHQRDKANGHIVPDEPVVVEPEPGGLTRTGVAEIDQSVVGGVHVLRVQSVNIPPPQIEPLQMLNGGEERATWGMGSVAGNQELPAEQKGRAAADLLNSFLEVSVLQQGNESAGKDGREEASEKGSPVTQPSAGAEEETKNEPSHQAAAYQDLTASPVLAEPSAGFFIGVPRPDQVSVGKDARVQYSSNDQGLSGAAQSSQVRSSTSRSYSSPLEIDEDTLSELIENDNMSLSDCQGLLSQPKRASPPEPVIQKQAVPNNIPVPAQTPHRLSPLMKNSDPYSISYSQNGVAPRIPPDVFYRPANNSTAYGTRRGATAPPLSETAYVSGGAPSPASSMAPVPKRPSPPSWQSPGRSDYRSNDALTPPRMSLDSIDQHSVFLALKTPDAYVSLFGMWKQGHRRTVASGLAVAHDLAGTEMLGMACEFLKRSNQLPPDRQDPMIARDLCTAIGNIARNQSIPISPDAVLMTLRVALSTLYAHHHTFNQNAQWSVQVYAACNFALCNLFKVYNVIHEPKLRTELANWIAYSISWNVFQDGVTQGPHLDILSYTATSAARNFMWMNEDNVVAFTSRNPGGGAPATSRLISSMKYFDWAQSFPVLEASLSALAMIIHFPPQRVEFMNRHGVRTLMDVLHRHANHAQIATLVFSMITVLLSGPTNNKEEVEMVRKGFIVDDGCQGLVLALEQARQQAAGEVQRMEVLDKGYQALVTISRFSATLRANMAERAMASVVTLAQWLASTTRGGRTDEGVSRARARLGATLCEVVQELAKERGPGAFLREQRVAGALETLLFVHGADGAFAGACRGALAALS